MAILLKTVTGVKHDGTGQLQDLLANLLSKWLRRAKIPHMGSAGGFKSALARGSSLSSSTNSQSSTPKALPMPRPNGSDRASSLIS